MFDSHSNDPIPVIFYDQEKKMMLGSIYDKPTVFYDYNTKRYVGKTSELESMINNRLVPKTNKESIDLGIIIGEADNETTDSINLQSNQPWFISQESIQSLNNLGIDLIEAESLLDEERARTDSWINAFENKLISKWEMREGILYSNESYESYIDKLLNEFYGDEHNARTKAMGNLSESGIYSQMEGDEFYMKVDKMI